MSSQMKGLISVVIGIYGFFSTAIVDMFGFSQYVFLVHTVPAVLCLFAIYLGIQARKGGAKYWGLVGIVLSTIAALSHWSWIFLRVNFQ